MPTSLPLAPAGDTPQPISPLEELVHQAIEQHGGWLRFDTFMGMALYTPGLGYYSSGRQKFGHLPGSGSDFVTAPELSPLFGQALARQLAQALTVTSTHAIWEFGAGTGALAEQLLMTLTAAGQRADLHYHIIELSADLRQRQQQRLAPFAGRVHWHDALPNEIRGVVVGNEVLDAMPVRLLARVKGQWFERGVVVHQDQLQLADRPEADLAQSLPVPISGDHDYLTEWPQQALAFVTTLAEHLVQGAAFFIDYGFDAATYYHPQRHMGTLVCHHQHRVDHNPLMQVGDKDITAHVDFTSMAMAWQNAGDALAARHRGRPELGTLGYCSQGRFLLNCGLGELLAEADPASQNAGLKLVHEHEMGELFKVLGLYVGEPWHALGFETGDRSHLL